MSKSSWFWNARRGERATRGASQGFPPRPNDDRLEATVDAAAPAEQTGSGSSWSAMRKAVSPQAPQPTVTLVGARQRETSSGQRRTATRQESPHSAQVAFFFGVAFFFWGGEGCFFLGWLFFFWCFFLVFFFWWLFLGGCFFWWLFLAAEVVSLLWLVTLCKGTRLQAKKE